MTPFVALTAAASLLEPYAGSADLPALAQAALTADGSQVFSGPVLPGPRGDLPRDYWLVGVAAEAFGNKAVSDQLFGVTVSFRHSAFAPHADLMFDPSIDGLEETRLLAGLGERAFFPVLGTELSYGIALHFEVELKDHYWLLDATPLELGARLYGKGSWNIQLFIGARAAFAGELIDHFLIDPNGFDNEAAADELDDATSVSRWGAFARIVFGHRLD